MFGIIRTIKNLVIGVLTAGLLMDARAAVTGSPLAFLFEDADISSEEAAFEYETAVITKIADGDTITVEIDGETERVRFLEVDTPESVSTTASKNSEYGEKASEYTKSRLSIGQTVYLTRDQSDTDRYGRLLRMIWLEIPDDPYDEDELREKCYNAELLLEGYARTAIYDDYAYEDIFKSFQEEAMEAGKGLWSDVGWWAYYEANY